jgi:hypothetical protein
MLFYINMKSIGKRKSILERIPYELPEGISTLRELVT